MSKPKGSVGEYTYQSEPIDRFKMAESTSKDLKPFRPSSPSRKGRGYYGTFTWSGQEYMSETDINSKTLRKSASNPDLPKCKVLLLNESPMPFVLPSSTFPPGLAMAATVVWLMMTV
eukprot:768607-Hanusia_phi.AAC.3